MQGILFKYDIGVFIIGFKKYDVCFFIGSFGWMFLFVYLLDVMVDVWVLECVCYEESLKSWLGIVSSLGGFIVCGVLVIVFELGKLWQSFLIYEDYGVFFVGYFL